MLIQSDQKQHSFGVVEGRDETVLGVGVVVVAVVVAVVVEVTGVVVAGVGEEKGGKVDMQMLKCFSTVALGPQISQ